MTAITSQFQSSLNFTQQLHPNHHHQSYSNPIKSTIYPTKPTSQTPKKIKTLPLKTNSDGKKSTKNPGKWERKKQGYVDYDKGEHHVSEHVSGLRKDDIPRRYRIKVQADKFQKDWSITQVVQKILALNTGDDIEGILNHWVGRFARKNYPVLIQELTQLGSIEHAIHVFSWMKNQKNYCARNDIYNMMIRLHARQNNVDQARGLFFEMQKWKCKPDAETYNALINAHGRAGQWRWATNIMEDMLRAAIPPSRSTYNNLINACGSCGNWREALKICKQMTDNGVGPDLVTHNIILSSYKTGAQYSKALSYFELMKGTNIRPDTTTLNIVIYCLAKLGHYEEAVGVLKSMREKKSECRPDVVTFTSIMHMYSVCGEFENCKAVFHIMLGEGLKPNIVAYNTLLGAYASQGMSEEALKVFNEMKQYGIRPDVVSYTSLLNAYGRSQKPKKAKEAFDLMKKHCLKPNIISYNALIDAYGSNGCLAEAVEVLREMEREGIQPNVVSISTLLAACGHCYEKVVIDSVLSAAEKRGIELNLVAYSTAIGSYMNVGEFDKALSLFKAMREKNVKPDSGIYNVLISGCCKVSKYDQAINFLNEMTDLNIPVTKEVYSSAISAYTDSSSASSLCLSQGRLAEADSMFTRMKTAGCQPDVITYTKMIHAYSEAEKWDKACAIFQEMEANDIQPDVVACSALMRAFNKGSQPAKVLILLEYMKEKNLPLSNAVHFEVLSACSLLRDCETAINLINVMEPTFLKISTGFLNHLLQFLGKSGKMEAMMKLFLKIVASGSEINFSTYSTLLKNLLAAGNWRKYVEVLQWMEEAGLQPSVAMYRDVLYFAQRSGGSDLAAVIQERIDSLKSRPQNLASRNQVCSSSLSASELTEECELHPQIAT
uniref:PROP1-like PPR domain-containing protein n=1 Tax=Chenopodium quinoa TaxID=63459 RepID=A0A803MAD0_CHEQI